ncbi:MAG: hypothetical protein ACLFR1_05180 [Spirochaetia bacterium]
MKKNILYVIIYTLVLVVFLSCGAASISVEVEGEGLVNIYPDASRFTEGSQIVIEAVPGEYRQFGCWGGDLTSFENPVSLTMDVTKAITASFALCTGEEGNVIVQEVSGRTVPVGEMCYFSVNLNLPESDQYRVWIYPDGNTLSSDSATNLGYYFYNSEVVQNNETEVLVGGGLKDYDTDEYCAGSCTHWFVNIDTWDSENEENVDYAQYRFEYPVTWE